MLEPPHTLHPRLKLSPRHFAPATVKHGMSISDAHDANDKRQAEDQSAPSVHQYS
jgi:hypothetical protein